MQRDKEKNQWPNPITLIQSYHSVIDHWFVSHPKKASRKVKQICFMKRFYEMISGPHLCYALHRVRVCLLSFLHFSAMRFASLYRRKRETVVLVLRVKSKRKRQKGQSLARSRELLENGEIIRSLVKEGPTTSYIEDKRRRSRRSQSSLKIEEEIGQLELCHSEEIFYREKACIE